LAIKGDIALLSCIMAAMERLEIRMLRFDLLCCSKILVSIRAIFTHKGPNTRAHRSTVKPSVNYVYELHKRSSLQTL